MSWTEISNSECKVAIRAAFTKLFHEDGISGYDLFEHIFPKLHQDRRPLSRSWADGKGGSRTGHDSAYLVLEVGKPHPLVTSVLLSGWPTYLRSDRSYIYSNQGRPDCKTPGPVFQ